MMDVQRFYALWERNLMPGARWDAHTAFEHLECAYAEKGRYYHNATHIEEMLAWLDRYRDQAEDLDAVELAVWFHDACYGPEPKGHESRSAKLFRTLTEGGLAGDRQQRICDLIMATTHVQPPETVDQALLVDIDLSSFARDWHPFLKDTALCRAEKRQMPDEEFCCCQLDFLRMLLQRPRLYYSPVFRQHHEADARANIARLIDLLEKRRAASA